MSTRRRSAELPRPSWGWQENAACRGEDITVFFGRDGETRAEREAREPETKKICDRCPVHAECLDYAGSRPEKYGYWAMNEDERAAERRKRLRKAHAA